MLITLGRLDMGPVIEMYFVWSVIRLSRLDICSIVAVDFVSSIITQDHADHPIQAPAESTIVNHRFANFVMALVAGR